LDRMIIWPSFINSELSRSEGRRLNRKMCVKSPKVEEMSEAATRLGMKPEVAKKAFPRRWHVERKALLLGVKTGRTQALKRIAEEVRRKRSERS